MGCLKLVPKEDFRPWLCPSGHENRSGGCGELGQCQTCGTWVDLGFAPLPVAEFPGSARGRLLQSEGVFLFNQGNTLH